MSYFNFNTHKTSLKGRDFSKIKSLRKKMVNEINIMIDVCKHEYRVIFSKVLIDIDDEDED